MAVDFAVPLITNVKCAKLFIEAIARRPDFQITSLDQKSRHQSLVLPGLVNLNAVYAHEDSDVRSTAESMSQAAVRGGFTTLQVLPIDSGKKALTADQADALSLLASKVMHCDWAFGVNAEAALARDLKGVNALALLFDGKSTAVDIAKTAEAFQAWPEDKPIVTNGTQNDLASTLLLANLYNRSIHVTGVKSKQDIEVIALGKSRQLKVTCDVSVYALFFTTKAYPAAACLPSQSDSEALWANLDSIDAFSVGSLPSEMARQLGQKATASAGFEEVLPLLLSAVRDGRLTVEGLVSRLSDNPRRIFNLESQPDTYTEVELGRSFRLQKGQSWSPLANENLTGAIHRVVLRGNTVFLDGKLDSRAGQGVNAADAGASSAQLLTKSRRKSTRFSISSTTKPALISAPSESLLSRSPIVGGDSRSAAATLKSPTLGPVRPESLLQVADPSEFSRFGSLLPSPFATAALPAFPLVPAFHRRHILSVKQFNRNDIHALFNIANEMRIRVERNSAIDLMRGRVLVTLFYEASTRTSTSFEAAMLRLGGTVSPVPVGRSSVTKGESLADTIRTVGCYADAIVLRHPDVGSAQLAAKFSPIPILNGGDGTGEHPSQVSNPGSEVNFFPV